MSEKFFGHTKNILRKILPSLYIVGGSFIVASGWNWYHLSRADKPHWITATIALAIGAMVALFIFKATCFYLAARFKLSEFWRNQFSGYLNELFFIFSLLFLVFFWQNEIFNLLYTALIGIFLFFRINFYFSFHSNSAAWRAVNRSLFLLSMVIFAIMCVAQTLAARYYILDENIKYYNIILFRAVAMTLFWLLGYCLAVLAYLRLRNWRRYLALILWTIIFSASLIIWAINVGVLYFSGLYFGPMVLQHAEGGGGVAWNSITLFLFIGLIFAITAVLITIKKASKAYSKAPKHYWYFYCAIISVMALGAIFTLTSFKNTPEYVIARSFYDYLWGEKKADPVLNSEILSKLNKFGIKYNPDQFYVGQKDKIFETNEKYLPAKLLNNKPNIVIVFLESQSAKFSDVYYNYFPGLTPGFSAMAADPHTTIFRNYYNSSVPTVTGLMSQLCSFLPPTGQNEIEGEKKLQRHHLFCLPQALKDNAGYKYANYITAVRKDFAHKDTIFESMGVDDVYGTDELAKFISGEPLSWGYSDHQMFPILEKFMKEKPQPFLTMLSTVDNHPPFTKTKDMVFYGDGKNNMLNSIHTTDNAFGLFWKQFITSDFYKNTIVIAVADHAMFPSEDARKLLPKGTPPLSFFDDTLFLMYIPDSILPKEFTKISSGLDFAPTLLNLLNINPPNAFEGLSIFNQRKNYPNVLGMYEFGLYINQLMPDGKRKAEYRLSSDITCPSNESLISSTLNMCEYLDYYRWKREMFEQGRFWQPI